MKPRTVQDKIDKIESLSKQFKSEKDVARREQIRERISSVFADLDTSVTNAEKNAQAQLRAEVNIAKQQFAALDKQFAAVDAVQDAFLKGTNQISRNNSQEVEELLAICSGELALEQKQKANTPAKPLVKVTFDVEDNDPFDISPLIQGTEEMLDEMDDYINSIVSISDEDKVENAEVQKIVDEAATEQEEQEQEEQELEEQELAEQELAEQELEEQELAEQELAEQELAEQELAEQAQTAQAQAEQAQAAQAQAEQAQAAQKQPPYTAVLDRAENIRHKLERKQEEIKAARIALGSPDEVRKNPQKKEKMQVYNEQLQNTTMALATVISLIIRPLKALFNFVSSFFGKSREETQAISIEMSTVVHHQKNAGREPVSDLSNLQKQLQETKEAIANQARDGKKLKTQIDNWKTEVKDIMRQIKSKNPEKDPKEDPKVVKLGKHIVRNEKLLAEHEKNIAIYTSKYQELEKILHKIQQKENKSIGFSK